MTLRLLAASFCLITSLFSEIPSAELRMTVESRAKQLLAWSTDPKIVAAVRAHNELLSSPEQSMTNQKWKALTLLDPFVRSYSKNELARHLQSMVDESIAEAFVSGADGAKVAFLSKPTYWSHLGEPKHEVPMTGKLWMGPVGLDASTGAVEVQVGIPVLDGGRPIGSIVVGLRVMDPVRYGGLRR